MTNIPVRIGMDTGKSVFQLHGVASVREAVYCTGEARCGRRRSTMRSCDPAEHAACTGEVS